MAGELTRNYFTYVSDNGDSYNVKLGEDIGALAELGFAAGVVTQDRLPRGIRMRHADCLHKSTGRRRRYPIALVGADAWSQTDLVIAVKDKGSATAVDWDIVALIGERRQTAFDIH